MHNTLIVIGTTQTSNCVGIPATYQQQINNNMHFVVLLFCNNFLSLHNLLKSIRLEDFIFLQRAKHLLAVQPSLSPPVQLALLADHRDMRCVRLTGNTSIFRGCSAMQVHGFNGRQLIYVYAREALHKKPFISLAYC